MRWIAIVGKRATAIWRPARKKQFAQPRLQGGRYVDLIITCTHMLLQTLQMARVAWGIKGRPRLKMLLPFRYSWRDRDTGALNTIDFKSSLNKTMAMEGSGVLLQGNGLEDHNHPILYVVIKRSKASKRMFGTDVGHLTRAS